MMFYDHNEKLPKYSSYKKATFERYKGKLKSLIDRLNETSLKQEDKAKLIQELVITASAMKERLNLK